MFSYSFSKVRLEIILLKNMNPNDENEISEVKKGILAREKVQQEMDDSEPKSKSLEMNNYRESSVHKDIEAYLIISRCSKREGFD